MTAEAIGTVEACAADATGNVAASQATLFVGDANNDERPVVFPCQGECLLGILHPATGDAVIVVVVTERASVTAIE